MLVSTDIKPPVKAPDGVPSEWKVKDNKPKSRFYEIIWYFL